MVDFGSLSLKNIRNSLRGSPRDLENAVASTPRPHQLTRGVAAQDVAQAIQGRDVRVVRRQRDLDGLLDLGIDLSWKTGGNQTSKVLEKNIHEASYENVSAYIKQFSEQLTSKNDKS